MSMKSLFGALALMLLLAGCAQVERGIKPVEAADPSASYVYGNFLMQGRGAAGVALEVRQVSDGQKILIKFRKDGRLVVNKLRPGRYVINRWYALSLGNQIQGSGDLVAPPFNVAFDVVAGRAYYLGDFEGRYGFGNSQPGLSIAWQVAASGDTFAAATHMFQSGYPELRALPTARAFAPR